MIPPLDEENYRYSLGVDPLGDVILFQNLHLYRQRIYRFALKLIVVVDECDVEIERIDTCHEVVHRHRLDSRGVEERVLICPFSSGDHGLVTAEHDRAYDEYVDNWEHRVRLWKERR